MADPINETNYQIIVRDEKYNNETGTQINEKLFDNIDLIKITQNSLTTKSGKYMSSRNSGLEHIRDD